MFGVCVCVYVCVCGICITLWVMNILSVNEAYYVN